ncbi:V-SNARE [Magnaporthiopsis poae ATCC 64411]|uniref:V-SNARE n=1 Tax=Magnaporthiopsis poae (strain ATCC 64411 / 73-15) TaxID=644358 RepID=A0A0C4EDY9_MAGP6|nr:V-SNARE [Magnaporthiopsis poae ATCC 64411]
MSNPNALFLLADHIKLSLLERKRARSLDLAAGDTQDGHIARSLDQFREGLEALEKEHKRLEAAGDESKALDLADALPTLQKQLDDLTSQFHGFSTTPSIVLTKPNDPSLAADFAHASTVPSAITGKRSASGGSGHKTVRFTDNTKPNSVDDEEYDSDLDRDLEAARAGLFGAYDNNNGPYRDDPDGTSYRDRVEGNAVDGAMDNVQVHAYHQRLDSHVAMLDESERLVDRHQSALDWARRQVGRISRSAGDTKQMGIIIALIVILLLLIAILK